MSWRHLAAGNLHRQSIAHLRSTVAWCQCVCGWCGEVDSTTCSEAPKRCVKLASNQSTKTQHSVGSCMRQTGISCRLKLGKRTTYAEDMAIDLALQACRAQLLSC